MISQARRVPRMTSARRAELRSEADRERMTRAYLGDDATGTDDAAHDLADAGDAFCDADALDVETARVRGFRAVEEL